MDKNFADELLLKTKKDYNLIGEDFANKRSFEPRPSIKNLILKYFRIYHQIRILDWGCGHGRYYPLFKQAQYYGVDVSEKLIEIAKNKYPNANFLINPSFISLPFNNDFFDYVICLATLHHIPSVQYRMAFAKEIYRTLKPNGMAIITVWDLTLSHLLKKLKFRRIFFVIKSLMQKICRGVPLEKGGVLIPWGKQCERYFHRFSKKELETLFKKNGFQIIASGYLKHLKETDVFLVIQKV